MLDILKIVYQFENQSATTSQISTVRHILGYPNEKSYNSLMVQNGKRVKNYFNKNGLINSKGEESFWNWFFEGEYLKEKKIIQTKANINKSAIKHRGLTIPKEDIFELLETDITNEFSIIIDGITSDGRLDISGRVFYKNDKVSDHIQELKNNNQKELPITIEIKDSKYTGFQFKLRYELVQAIKELYPQLDQKYAPKTLHNIKEYNNTEEIEHTEKTINKILSFNDYLNEKEFLFDKETIENYLLSLKVKPFTILTGNSGTGKTKIAQLFANHIHYTKKLEINNNYSVSLKNNEYQTINIKLNTDWNNSQKLFKKDDFKSFLPLENYEGICDIQIDDLPVTAKCHLYPYLTFNKEDENKIKENNTKETTIQIKTTDIKNALDSTGFTKNEYECNCKIPNKIDYKYLVLYDEDNINILPRKEGKRNWKLIINDNPIIGKFKLIFELKYNYKHDKNEKAVFEHISRKKKQKQEYVNVKIDLSSFKPFTEIQNFTELNENYKIIPVGANWTENRNIVGYYNPITEEYQSTPAYELIKEAIEDKNNPYFLILDEMNLSHVERYFADFLSAIESGENIPLYGTDEELILPENLFIIGTVNVDETTYMFSPKVLDRANTIEFETYPAYDYMTGEFNLQSPQGDLDYLQNPLSDLNIKNLGIKELKEKFQNVKINGDDFWEIFSEEIFNLQLTLKESGFDFGFRVINEIARFMYVAWKYEGKPTNWTNWNRYLDAQIKQKMLPKLHGSEKIIGETLGNLYAACEYTYPTSAKKLLEMIDVLEKQRYVSFIN